MTITFDGTQIKCGNRHSHLALTGGEVQARRTFFWGVIGVSEIVAAPTFYQAECKVWINDPLFTTRARLNDYRETLRELRGVHGELLEKMTSGLVSERWQEATFEGFEETVFPGHEIAGPIQDVTGMVTGVTNAWFTQGMMRWTLLSDER